MGINNFRAHTVITRDQRREGGGGSISQGIGEKIVARDRGCAGNNVAEKNSASRGRSHWGACDAQNARVAPRGVENGTGHASGLLDGRARAIRTLSHLLGCDCSGLTIIYLGALPWL